MIKEAIKNYLETSGHASINLKAVLFDMDGVLYDSMPNHADSWHRVMKNIGLTLSREEAYMHEGRTGASTINLVSQRERGYAASEEEIQAIYKAKTEEFNKCPLAEPMPYARQVLEQVKATGLTTMLVTGSGQASLLDRLNGSFPNSFQSHLMVTAYDVKHGKPHPEPYLMGLDKGGLKANEAIVIENAPLGVQSAVAAGIFTVAVNTGPLDDAVLLNEGAHLLFHSMEELNEAWEALYKAFSEK
ncbi:MAG: HAD-IA family hydrolase [Phocaeicola sp.]